MIQRRQYKRALQRIHVTCQHDTVVLDGFTRDLCPGGVFIVSARLLAPRSRIDIDIHFETGAPVHCCGEVMWVNRGQVPHYPPGFGVRFLDMDGYSAEWVAHLCTGQEEEWSPIPW